MDSVEETPPRPELPPALPQDEVYQTALDLLALGRRLLFLGNNARQAGGSRRVGFGAAMGHPGIPMPSAATILEAAKEVEAQGLKLIGVNKRASGKK